MKSIKLGIKLFIFLIFVSQLNPGFAQTKKINLTKNSTISDAINSGQKHQYSVKLKKNKFAFFKLMQKDVDLIITTFDADGEKIEDFDSPNGKNGPEYISIFSSKKGMYLLEVRALNPNSANGKYDLRIEKIEAKGKTPDKQVDQLFAKWDNQNNPGAAIGIIRNGKLVYSNGYGMANLDYNIPLSPNSKFYMASVSKQFTATCIALLSLEGKINLDDDIRKYIPEIPKYKKKITIRHLVHHTSGLRDYLSLMDISGRSFEDFFTIDDGIRLLSKQKNLNFSPGEEYAYSNSGYILLAEIVNRTSGMTIREYAEKNIFKPLGMKDTFFNDNHNQITRNRVISYRSGENETYQRFVQNFDALGDGNLITTVNDMFLWDQNSYSKKVGGDKLKDLILTKGKLNNGKNLEYAFGLVHGNIKGLRTIGHGGSFLGFRTNYIRFPDENFSVIILSNDSFFFSGQLTRAILDIYLKDELAAKGKTNPKKVVIPKKTEKEIKSVKVDLDVLKSYVGSYEINSNFIIKITQQNGKLYGQATGQSRLGLVAETPTEFKVVDVNAKISFHKDDNNKVNLLKLHQGGQIQDAKRIKPFDPKSVELSDFTGHFYSEELLTEYDFTFEDGNLVAKHSRLNDIKMTPINNKGSFIATNGVFREIEFARNQENEVIGCKVSSGRIRDLWLEKVNKKKP